MLNFYQYFMLNYPFKTFYHPQILFLFFTLLIQVDQFPIDIFGTLGCQKYKFYTIPLINSSINSYFVLIQFENEGSQSILSISNQFPSLSNIGRLSPDKLWDKDSLLLNKKVQSLYFTSSWNQSQFFILVQQISSNLLNYSSNTDRTRQSLSLCPQINFRIKVYDLSLILFWDNEARRLPQFRNQCVNGQYNFQKQSCSCQDGYYMRLCDTSLRKIEKLDQITRKSIRRKNYDYFYFTPNISIFDERQSIILSIYIEGSYSSTYKYLDSNKFPGFILFWNIQKIGQKLQVATYFTQQNPSLIESIIIRPNQVLTLTLYKPEWSVQEDYTIRISSQPILTKQIMIIIISISVGIALLLFFFVFYVFYVKNGRAHRFYNPGGASFGKNKISNDYFPIQVYFPSVSYKQFQQSIFIEGEVGKNLCCICLDEYTAESQVRSTYCLHLFHAGCLEKWIQKQRSCPLCRQNFSEQNLGAAQQKMQSIEKYKRIWRGDHRIKRVKKVQITFEGESNYNIQNISGQNNS